MRWPTCLRRFPSLEALSSDGDSGCWELRYVCLLWLSLICMIPFDLAKFDRPDQRAKGHNRLTNRSGGRFLHHQSWEGEGRRCRRTRRRLFQRSDVQLGDHFSAFLDTSLQALKDK